MMPPSSSSRRRRRSRVVASVIGFQCFEKKQRGNNVFSNQCSGGESMKTAMLTIVLMAVAAPLFGASSSVYTLRLEDPQATYLSADRFPVHADGKGDDSVAIQQAIDRVQETTGQGILFIPSGQYRLTRTLFVWPGIRLIGYGPTRPVFALADDTPGFQTGPAYMVFFAGFRPGTLSPRSEKLFANRFPNGHPPPTPGTVPPSFVPDANPGGVM